MLKEILKTIDQYEGGLCDDPADPGGETKYGISKAAYPDIDIPSLTIEQAYDLARRDYYDRMRCSEFNSIRVRWKLFDIGFNCGVTAAAKILQRAAKVRDDGIIGPLTIGAVNRIIFSSIGENMILQSMVEQQVKKYVAIVISNSKQIVFLKGWINRAFDYGEGLK